MKIALFSFPQFPDLSPDVKSEAEAKYTTMVRVTDWVDVAFPPRDPVELLADKIDNVDAQITQAKREKNETLGRLEALRRALEAEAVLQS